MKMTYKIVYRPNAEDRIAATSKDIDFLCVDNKLHIRLRDYDHEEVIHGFVNKLTYVVTYLFQRAVVSGELTTNIFEKFVNSDTSLKNLSSWLETVYEYNGKSFKGLKISENYRKIKKSVATPLGSFMTGTCPLKDGITYGDIDFFASSLNFIPIEELILNDSLDIVISKDVVKDTYTKFTNKSKKVKKDKLEYIPLF
jgi:hypothetical protein